MNRGGGVEQRVSVVGICGNIRSGSYTRMALVHALSRAQEAGAQTMLIDLKEYALIFCDGKEDESIYPTDVFRLREQLKAAQGIILGTPEYHGSYSGILKNALDLMGFDEFEGKMVGLVGVSGGQWGPLKPSIAYATWDGRCTPGSFRNRSRLPKRGALSTPMET